MRQLKKARAARSTFHSNETLAEAMCQRSAVEIQKWKQKRFKNAELILVISHVCKIQPITSELGFSSVASEKCSKSLSYDGVLSV